MAEFRVQEATEPRLTRVTRWTEIAFFAECTVTLLPSWDERTFVEQKDPIPHWGLILRLTSSKEFSSFDTVACLVSPVILVATLFGEGKGTVVDASGSHRPRLFPLSSTSI